MSDSWARGYFTRLPYTFGYYREMAPAHLRFCLLLAGIMPPLGNAYCELAMGQGYSANIHAAANEGRFSANDFLPEHALFASRMADAAQTGLMVSDADIGEFVKTEHPQYDFICLHGGWSWIDEASREDVVDFASRFLKSGGIFYISYNCWPGWLAAAPLRKLLAMFNAFYGAPGADPAATINDSLTLAEALLACEPLFLNASPWISEHFEKLKKEPPQYLAHEFLNADWHVEWFMDIAKKLGAAKLSFAASARSCDNIHGFGLTEDARRFCGEIANVVVREQARDFFCNTRFRQDIFVKGMMRLDQKSQIKLLGSEKFVLVIRPEKIVYSLACGMGNYEMDQALHGGIARILAEDNFAPKSLAYLSDRMGDMADFFQVAWAVARLVAKDYAHPCKAEMDRQDACARLNKYIVDYDPGQATLNWLASPLTGAGLARKEICPDSGGNADIAAAHGLEI